MNFNLLKKTIIVLSIIWIISIPISAETIEYIDGSTTDGYLQKSDSDYDTAWGKVSGHEDADSVDNSGNTVLIGQRYSGGVWTVRKSYFYFDTSNVPNSAKIYGAWLDFYVNGAPAETTYVTARQGVLSPSTPLVVSNFDYNDYSVESDDSLLISSTGSKQLILYDNGRGLDIDTDGITKFVLIPDFVDGGDTNSGWISINSAESSNKPQIRLEYNCPPNTPAAPVGDDSHHKLSNYPITFSTTDIDGDDIEYKIDWGDGTVTNWLGPYASGQEVKKSHQYGSESNYSIKIKARDTAQIVENGRLEYCDNRENPTWSSAKTITITKMASVDPPDPTNFIPDDPDQGINRVTAEFRDGEAEGTNALYVWWNLTEAARMDPDLRLSLAVETIEGVSIIATTYAWRHMMPESAFIVEDWNNRFGQGSGRWNFVLQARLDNVDEPSDASTDNNRYDLRFVLGFPLTFEHLLLVVAIAAIAIFIILVIFYRKGIFYRFYTPYENIPGLDEINASISSAKLKRSLERLKKRKGKYGDTGIPGVEPVKDVGRKGVSKLRGVKARLLMDLEDVGERWDKYYPSRPGPRSPVRLAEFGKSKKEKEKLRENAKKEEQAAREAAIGTGIVERLFYPSKREKRIAAAYKKERKEREEEERKKRSERGKKGAKTRKEREQEQLKEWGTIEPPRMSIAMAEQRKPITIEKQINDLNTYINKMNINLEATSSKPKRKEIIRRIENAEEQKKNIANVLSMKKMNEKLNRETEKVYKKSIKQKSTDSIKQKDVRLFNKTMNQLKDRYKLPRNNYGVKELYAKIGKDAEMHMWTDEELAKKQPTTVVANLNRLSAANNWAKRKLRNLKKVRVKKTKKAGEPSIEKRKEEYENKKKLYISTIDQTEKAIYKQREYVEMMSGTGGYFLGKDVDTRHTPIREVEKLADEYVRAIEAERKAKSFKDLSKKTQKILTSEKHQEAFEEMVGKEDNTIGGEPKYSRYRYGRTPKISTGFKKPSMKNKKIALWHKHSSKKKTKNKKTKPPSKKYYYRTITAKNGKKKRVKCKMPTTKKKKQKKKSKKPSRINVTWW